MKQKYSGIVKIGLLIIAVAVAVWFAQNTFFTEEKAEIAKVGFKTGKTSIVFNYGGGVVVTKQAAADGTVLDVTKNIAAANNLTFETKEYPGMGTMVTRIGDKKNGEGGAYWQFWVNGAYAVSSADNIVVHPNDNIEWKFTSSAQ